MPCKKGGTIIVGNDRARFDSKTKPDGDCIVWIASTRRGYGCFQTADMSVGKQVTHAAHRWNYEQLVGPIPTGLVLMHSCDRPRCVNVEHLKPGTHKDNRADAVSKLRHRHGEAHHSARLTRALVIEIRQRLAAGESRRLVARSMRVGCTAIDDIARGHTWRHVS